MTTGRINQVLQFWINSHTSKDLQNPFSLRTVSQILIWKTNDRFDCEAFSWHSWTCMNNIGTQATLVVHTISHIVSIHIDDYVYNTAFRAISFICAHELIEKFTVFTITFHDAQFETPTKLFQLLPAECNHNHISPSNAACKRRKTRAVYNRTDHSCTCDSAQIW